MYPLQSIGSSEARVLGDAFAYYRDVREIDFGLSDCKNTGARKSLVEVCPYVSVYVNSWQFVDPMGKEFQFGLGHLICRPRYSGWTPFGHLIRDEWGVFGYYPTCYHLSYEAGEREFQGDILISAMGDLANAYNQIWVSMEDARADLSRARIGREKAAFWKLFMGETVNP